MIDTARSKILLSTFDHIFISFWQIAGFKTFIFLKFLKIIYSAVIVLKMGKMQQQQGNSFYSLFFVVDISVWWVAHIDYTHYRPNSYFTVEHPKERHCHLSLHINLPQFTLLLCWKARHFKGMRITWLEIKTAMTGYNLSVWRLLVALRCSSDMRLAVCFGTVSQSLMQWHSLHPFLSHTVRSTAVCSGSMPRHPLES